ncbi:MAG: hypothetical protein QXM08_06165 [Thermofilaceae archaeon]
MSILGLDSKSRLTILKRVSASLGIEKKVLVITGDYLKVVPIPSDPFKALHGAFNAE